MIYWFRRKWRQIKRVWDFLPIIWRGYDWDYRYAVELFQHQLKRTADEIENRGYQEGSHNTANRIRTAVELLEKVYDEEYAQEYQSIIEEKYGPSKMNFEKIEDSGENYWEVVEDFDQSYTEGELTMIREERHQLHLDSVAKQKRAHKLVWRYIEHNNLRWWD